MHDLTTSSDDLNLPLNELIYQRQIKYLNRVKILLWTLTFLAACLSYVDSPSVFANLGFAFGVGCLLGLKEVNKDIKVKNNKI